MAGEFRVDAEEQAELNRQRELKARAAAEVAALANINPDGGKYKTEPLQIAIPRKFNEVMGVVNRVLSVPVSTGLQLASMLEDPFNLDPDTPKQTELIAQVAGQGVETHLNTIKSAAVDAGIHPEHVDAAGNLLELAARGLMISGRGSGTARSGPIQPVRVKVHQQRQITPGTQRRLPSGNPVPTGEVGSVMIPSREVLKSKGYTLGKLAKVISESTKTKELLLRGKIKPGDLGSDARSQLRILNLAATGASRASAMVRVMRQDSDAVGLLEDPDTIVNRLATRQTDITLQPTRVGVIGHHIGMLKTFERPYLQMDLKKGLEVNNILSDKHNILLGQEVPNLQNMYSQLIHNTVAHAGSTMDQHIRDAFRKVDWKNITAEQAADEIAKQYWVAQQQAWKAGVHPVNIEAGWNIYNALPPDIKKRLPKHFNPLDPQADRKAYNEYRLLVNNLDPERVKKVLNATAKAEASMYDNNRYTSKP